MFYCAFIVDLAMLLRHRKRLRKPLKTDSKLLGIKLPDTECIYKDRLMNDATTLWVTRGIPLPTQLSSCHLGGDIAPSIY